MAAHPKAAPPTEERGAGRVLVITALLAVYLIWGSTYLAIRYAVKGIPPYLMAGSRFEVAGVVLFAILRLRGAGNPTRAEWLGGSAVGAFLLLGGMGSVAYAEQWIPSGLAALLVATTPLWAAVFGSLWGYRPGRMEIVGLVLGIAGVAVLNTSGATSAHRGAAVMILLGTMAWAFGSVWSRRLPLPAGLMSSAVEMIGGGACLLVVSLVRGEHVPGHVEASALIAYVYLIVIGSLVAYSAYVFLLAQVRPALATSYAYVNPIVAVVIGFLIAGERLSVRDLIALPVIVGAVVLAVVGQARTHTE